MSRKTNAPPGRLTEGVGVVISSKLASLDASTRWPRLVHSFRAGWRGKILQQTGLAWQTCVAMCAEIAGENCFCDVRELKVTRF
jgi:hypothetical protein